MKQAIWHIIVFTLFIGVGFGLGCKKKEAPAPNNNGTLVLRFHITGGGQPFRLNKTIVNTNGQHYNFNLFAFYASDVTLTGVNSQPIASILLVDADSNDIILNSAQVDTMFVLSVPAGSYSGLQFGIGPDKNQNQQGGTSFAYSNYAANSPLGYDFSGGNNLYYWGPNLGYLFFTGEGKYDTTANNTGGLNGNFFYHCGTDSDYNIKTLTGPIQIIAGYTTIFTINLETNDIFNGPPAINLKLGASNTETMTEDNIPLAKTVLQNLAAALKTN